MEKPIIKKLIDVERVISTEKGLVSFFALFQRMDVWKKEQQEKWDLVIEATWIKESDYEKNSEYIFKQLLNKFSGEEIASFLQKLVLKSATDEFLGQMMAIVGNQEPNLEYALQQREIKGKQAHIKAAYIIASRLG